MIKIIKKTVLYIIFMMILLILYNMIGGYVFYSVQVKASSNIEYLKNSLPDYALHYKNLAIFPPSPVSNYYTINFGPFFEKESAEQFNKEKGFTGLVYVRTYPLKKIYYCYLSPKTSEYIDAKKHMKYFYLLLLIILCIMGNKILKSIKKRRRKWTLENTWIVWR